MRPYLQARGRAGRRPRNSSRARSSSTCSTASCGARTSEPKVDYLESVEGEAIDYDFTRDVGLIRIRPGRKLPASRVVPAALAAQEQAAADEDAHRRLLRGERRDGLAYQDHQPADAGPPPGNPAYEAIECWNAPKQGRSGGGLFTTDGYIAGVCNFAEPKGNHGLYATPRSIYHILDRNNLVVLYAPVNRGSGSDILVADDRSPSSSSPSRPQRTLTPIARGQSPDPGEPGMRRASGGQGEVMLPHPRLLGIINPIESGDRASQAASGTTTSASPGTRSRLHRQRSRPARPSRPISRSSPPRTAIRRTRRPATP